MTILLLTGCTSNINSGQPTNEIPHILTQEYNVEALPLYDEYYLGNKLRADNAISSPTLQEYITDSVESLRENNANAYMDYSKAELNVIFSAVLYDELFRRDIADDLDDAALGGNELPESLLKRTLGVAQINPSIHLESIREAANNPSLPLVDAARLLKDDQISIESMVRILYKNHPQNITLAISRYHAGNISTTTERATYLTSTFFTSYIATLLSQ